MMEVENYRYPPCLGEGTPRRVHRAHLPPAGVRVLSLFFIVTLIATASSRPLSAKSTRTPAPPINGTPTAQLRTATDSPAPAPVEKGHLVDGRAPAAATRDTKKPADTFPGDLSGWLGFFGVLAGASTALLSIAFLTFQVKADQWRRDVLLQVVAIRTLVELLVPLFVSLVTLIPGHRWHLAGALAGAGGYVLVGYHVAVASIGRRRMDRFDKMQLVGSVTIMMAAYSILAFGALVWVASVLVWLLVSGSAEAWMFLDPPFISDERKQRWSRHAAAPYVEPRPEQAVLATGEDGSVEPPHQERGEGQ